MSAERRSEQVHDKARECRSLRWDKSTWHKYEPVDPDHGHRGDYVERCAKCGHERTVEVER